MTNEIKKQIEFVEWMKSKGIYDPMCSAAKMELMHEVWEKAGEGKHQKMWGELKDSVEYIKITLNTLNQISDIPIDVLLKSIKGIEEKHK